MSSSLPKWLSYVLWCLCLVALIAGAFMVGREYVDYEDKKQASGEQTTPSAVMNPIVDEVVLKANEDIERQIQNQVNGYPLLRNPYANTYQLKGKLANIKKEDIELMSGMVVKVWAELVYMDATSDQQTVKVPLVVENRIDGRSVYYGDTYSENLTSAGRIERFLGEHADRLLESSSLTVDIGFPDDVVEKTAQEEIVSGLVVYMHPDGYGKFVVDGDPSSLGNEDMWLIPSGVYAQQ